MTLNPFEQLAFFVPEPKRCFGEIVETILRGRFGTSGVQSCSAEGQTYVIDVPPASGTTKELRLYQAKYFVGRWRSAQRRQVREALHRALQDRCALDRWVLCVPTRLALEDLRWFVGWRKQCATKVEVLEGNELLKMLREPSASSALERIRSWGVTVPESDAPRVRGRLRVRTADSDSGLTHYLYASVYNGGGRAAKGLQVELAHSVTQYFSLRHDDKQWKDEGQGNLNPRTIRACRPVAPREERLVAVIPVGVQTPLPVSLRLRLSTEETATVEQRLCLDQAALAPDGRFDFVTGLGPEVAPVELPGVSAAAA